jgi:S1 RNA binding domain protein
MTEEKEYEAVKKVVKEKPKKDPIGEIVDGEVTNVTAFGAFVKILSLGEEGLVHISEVANEFITDISKFVSVGDEVQVKVMSRNAKGKLELSIKRTIEKVVKPNMFINTKSKDNSFEDRVSQFMKKSEEKQIDVRRNLKNKQGVSKKRR